MSTHGASDGHVAELPGHCEQCGHTLGAGRFCSGCGHERAGAGHAPNPALPPDDDRRKTVVVESPLDGIDDPHARRVRIVGALVGVGIVASAVVMMILLLSSPTDGDEDLAYSRQVASAFGPVLGANREVSLELSRLHGTVPTDARAAVRRARQSTTIATGALGALVVPPGSEAQARTAQQVLDREDAYLSAAFAVLSEPSSPTRSQLQTLSSNLTSAMSAAGGTIAATTQSVTGADRLASWAPRAARTLKRRAAVRRATGRPAATSALAVPAVTAAPSSASSVQFQTGYDAGQAWPAAVCRFLSLEAGAGVYCWTPNDGYTLRLDGAGAYRVRSDEAANRSVIPPGSTEISIGSTQTANGYSCTNRSDGLTCTSPQGHGWILPRYHGLPHLF